MKNERAFPFSETLFRSANEQAPSVSERLRHLHEAKQEFLTRGVFFDVFALTLPTTEENRPALVLKNFRCGDITMKPEEQVALFQHQYYEWEQLRHLLGEEFFPASDWIRSSKFSEDEAHGFFAHPGETANTFGLFVKIQTDRQLADRYSSDDQHKSTGKQIMSVLGAKLRQESSEQAFIGAVVQERVQGITFQEALSRMQPTDPHYPELRQATQTLIAQLRAYHEANPYTAFTWHGLASDNVMVEVDDEGHVTGRIQIVDANFTERPNRLFKTAVVNKLEKQVFLPLEKAFSL